MKYIFSIVTFSFILSLYSYSQDVEFKKKNFTDEAGFNQALSNIKKGDDLFSKQKKWLYAQALECYLKANEFNPNNSILNFKIGVCYLNSSDKASSLNYFLKAQSLKPDVDPKIEYAIAQGYHYNLQFDEAISFYEKARNALNIKSSDVKLEKVTSSYLMSIDKKIEECKNGKLLVANPLKVKIENLGPVINSKYTDYVSLVTQDEKQLIFTSRREGNTGKEIDQNELEYFEDIYCSTKENLTWTSPQIISGSVNTNSHDAGVGLSDDGKTLFVYRGLVNGGDLFEYKNENGIWSDPKDLSKINSSFHETSACISSDGKTLYLVSDRTDKAIGMRDIFVSHLNGNSEWSEPENIGTIINSQYDEEGVSLSSDGKTLYFSSTGHNTIGGFDMFKTTFENGAWSIPKNIGYPLNTPDNEMYPQVFGDKGSEHGYFSATRKEGLGSVDIYTFSMIQDQMVQKSMKDSTDNPENYRVPVESGDPANLFVNVNNESPKDTNTLQTKPVETLKVNKTGDEPSVVKPNVTNEPIQNIEKEKPVVVPNVEAKEQPVVKTNSTNDPVKNNEKEKPVLVSENNESQQPVVLNDNIEFKVQVGACHRKIPYQELHQRYQGKKNVVSEMHDGWYKYLIGNYQKYSEAKQEKLTCGTPDAWIVAYKGKQRVPISEVINLLSFYPCNRLMILMLS